MRETGNETHRKIQLISSASKMILQKVGTELLLARRSGWKELGCCSLKAWTPRLSFVALGKLHSGSESSFFIYKVSVTIPS